MLVTFSVSNFLSFNERTVFSMESGRVIKKPEHLFEAADKSLLRFAAMYGKNGAGKSNFVKSLHFFRGLVVKGKPGNSAPKFWCRVKEENEALPSEFEAQFIAGGRRMTYALGVVLGTGQIVSESLVLHNGGRKTALFRRKQGESDFAFHESLVGRNKALPILAKSFSVNESPLLFCLNSFAKGFLSANEGASPIVDAFKWFSQYLEIIFPDQPLREASILGGEISLKKFGQLLREFDTGISHIKMEEISREKLYSQIDANMQVRLNSEMEKLSELRDLRGKYSMAIQNRFCFFAVRFEINGEFSFFNLKFVHIINGREVEFTMENESDGTSRLFQLLEILITQKPKVFVIDEISRCLHPKLTVQFVKKYLALACVPEKQVQLITTTHETRLMTHEIVRRDEIWLCDSAADGSTELYSLEGKQVRIDKALEENYMGGEWGAIPQFKDGDNEQ